MEKVLSIINDNDNNLKEETKSSNKESIEIIYNEFNNVKNKLFENLKNKLLKKNLEINNKDFIENYYNSKSIVYKKRYSFKKFSEKVSGKIYYNVENHAKDIINNVANYSFNFFIMEILKNGLKMQFEQIEKNYLSEIYDLLFAD